MSVISQELMFTHCIQARIQGCLAPPPPPFSGGGGTTHTSFFYIKIGQPRSKIQAKTYLKTH